MRTSNPLIRVDGISKSFGGHRVLRDISINIHPGELVLMLGSNGAGKSTLLKILSGLSRADSGNITSSVAGRVEFVSASLQLYPRLTVRENLSFFQSIYASQFKVSLLDEVLDEWGLVSVAQKSVHDLSKGNQWKVALARAFLAQPTVLLLDEPTSNLDDAAVSVLLTKLTRITAQQGGSVVMATHDIARLEHAVNRVLIVDGGRKVSDSAEVDENAALRIQDFIELYRERNR